MQFYQVGGAVRDGLLGRPVKDRDWVVVGAAPDDLLRLGFRRVGKGFPVFLHPETGEEYALARRNRAPRSEAWADSFGGDVTLEEDLRCRDLTINAMALDARGTVIDPSGGRRDLDAGILRHVSDAFIDDPLRVLRVARFAARYDFHVAEETLALMARLAGTGRLDDLVPERVWTELIQAVGEPRPRRFFECLRKCQALERIFPEIHRLFGVPQPVELHPEGDTGLHTLLALAQATKLSEDTRVRFAVLAHDLGKGVTPRQEWPHHPGHEAAGVAVVRSFCQRLRAPREFAELASLAARFHTHCHRAGELCARTLVRLLDQLDALRRPERFELFLLACEADARGRRGREGAPYPQAAILRSALAAVRSVDSGPLVAQALKGRALANELHQLRVRAVRARCLQTDNPRIR